MVSEYIYTSQVKQLCKLCTTSTCTCCNQRPEHTLAVDAYVDQRRSRWYVYSHVHSTRTSIGLDLTSPHPPTYLCDQIIDLLPKLNKLRLVLASQSPRRLEILRGVGLKCHVVPSTVQYCHPHHVYTTYTP